MSFHLGKPILFMLALGMLCAVIALFRPAAKPRADLVCWVFSEPHAQTYAVACTPAQPSLTDSFLARTGRSVDVQLIFSRAQNVRLASMFSAGMQGPAVPDVVEMEIGQIGKFFRPPVRDVGFLPLNRYLETTGAREIASLDAPGYKGWHARLRIDGLVYTHDGSRWMLDPARDRPDMWIDRIVRNRLAPWSKDGRIFGVPHDVHPVALIYRHDLFLEAGIDLETLSSDANRPLTWRRFHELCLQFKQYWASRGVADRYPIELQTASAENLLMMLLQRHLNPLDAQGTIQMTSPEFAQTLAFYAQMVAGPRRIAAQSGVTDAAAAQDLNNGNLCAFMAPDWRVRQIKDLTAVHPGTGEKILLGRFRAIPLPIFKRGDAPTSTWGGTAIAIPRACPQPDLAWKLIEHLYLSKEGLQARIHQTKILPPVEEQWDDAAYHHPDPFFGDQKIDRLYAELARQIPERYVSPAITAASGELSFVLHKAIRHVNAHGSEGLEAACSRWLKEAADDLAGRIAWGTFE